MRIRFLLNLERKQRNLHCSCTESEKLQYPKHEKNSGLPHSRPRLLCSRYLGKFFPGFVHRRMVSDADQADTHAAQYRISDRLERPVPLHGTFARASHRASAAQRNHPAVGLATYRQLPVEHPVLHAAQSAGRIHRHRTAEYPRGTLHLRREPQGTALPPGSSYLTCSGRSSPPTSTDISCCTAPRRRLRRQFKPNL